LKPGKTEMRYPPHGKAGVRAYIVTMNTRDVTDKVQDWQKRAGETARNVGQVTDQYVRENTWTTIAIAAVLGCVLGYVLASRRD
jgi:ElaB/YqjD/DUF883 family membrane-anchored ribosome-binding protein